MFIFFDYRYVGKQYRLEKYKNNPRSMKQYKQDIICQVTSRYYVTQFNQQMYTKGDTLLHITIVASHSKPVILDWKSNN